MQTWNENEIKELLEYVQHLRKENEDLQAKIIVMDAYVKNGDAKIKQLMLILKQNNIW
jgi:disulfide oxidoreductase YuzD